MTDTFRALCAELTYCWSRTTNPDDFAENAAPIIGRMKAALAQPEPEGPSESDVTELFYRYVGEGSEVGFENAIEEALTRWGRPATTTETP